MPLLASGNYFLIKSSTGALDVRGEFGQAKAMIAGQGLSGRDFTKLELKNNTGATITGLILIEDGAENGNGFFDLNLIMSGSVIVRPELSSNWSNVMGILAANTAEQVLAPASNINGVLIQNKYFYDYQPNQIHGGLYAKNSAPSSVTDASAMPVGDITFIALMTGTIVQAIQQPEKEILVPAGLGLYWFFDLATTSVSRRTTRYKIL